MRTRGRHLRNTAFVTLLLVLIALSGCGKTYPIDDMEIDRDNHPGWYTYDGSDFVKHIRVYYRQPDGRAGTEPIQQADYLVFESSSAAKTYFNSYLDDCRESDSEIYDKGWGWFVAELPHTYDAEITRMFYLDGNVVICADIHTVCYSTLGYSSVYNNPDMKGYIIDHHTEMKEFVMGLFE